MSIMRNLYFGLLASAFATTLGAPAVAQQPQPKPNIVVIMGDYVGWFNIGAYHRGMMSGKTPNLDKLAAVFRLAQHDAHACLDVPVS
jgi:arylsulfatase